MTDATDLKTGSGDTAQGYAFAISAYVLWGGLPLYLKALSHLPLTEVVAHRVVWSAPVAGAVLIWLGRTADLRAALRDKRMLALGALTAALISMNWAIYIWAISNERTVDAALGYYINPLFSVLVGAVLLKERLDKLQTVAVLLAGLAVVYLTVAMGRLPIVSLGLVLSWSGYAFCKKQLPIGPNQGFLLEVLILSVPASLYLLWLGVWGGGHFMTGTGDTVPLMFAGLVTAVPLMLYANGAKLLRLSTIGILQYIAPTLIFLVAVLAFGEPVGHARMVALPMIWAALALYSISLVRAGRANADKAA